MEEPKYARWLKKIVASGITERLGLGPAPPRDIARWCYRALQGGAHLDDVRGALRAAITLSVPLREPDPTNVIHADEIGIQSTNPPQGRLRVEIGKIG